MLNRGRIERNSFEDACDLIDNPTRTGTCVAVCDKVNGLGPYVTHGNDFGFAPREYPNQSLHAIPRMKTARAIS